MVFVNTLPRAYIFAYLKLMLKSQPLPLLILWLDGLNPFKDGCDPLVFVTSQSVLVPSSWLSTLLLTHPGHLPQQLTFWVAVVFSGVPGLLVTDFGFLTSSKK